GYRGQRTIEGRGQARFGTCQFVERRLQVAAEICTHQLLKSRDRIDSVPGTEKTKPFGADGDMRFLVVVDDVQNCSGLMIASLDHFLQQGWRHIEPTSLENKRHDGETGFEIVTRLVGGLPESIMGGHVTVIRTQRLE